MPTGIIAKHLLDNAVECLGSTLDSRAADRSAELIANDGVLLAHLRARLSDKDGFRQIASNERQHRITELIQEFINIGLLIPVGKNEARAVFNHNARIFGAVMRINRDKLAEMVARNNPAPMARAPSGYIPVPWEQSLAEARAKIAAEHQPSAP